MFHHAARLGLILPIAVIGSVPSTNRVGTSRPIYDIASSVLTIPAQSPPFIALSVLTTQPLYHRVGTYTTQSLSSDRYPHPIAVIWSVPPPNRCHRIDTPTQSVSSGRYLHPIAEIGNPVRSLPLRRWYSPFPPKITAVTSVLTTESLPSGWYLPPNHCHLDILSIWTYLSCQPVDQRANKTKQVIKNEARYSTVTKQRIHSCIKYVTTELSTGTHHTIPYHTIHEKRYV